MTANRLFFDKNAGNPKDKIIAGTYPRQIIKKILCLLRYSSHCFRYGYFSLIRFYILPADFPDFDGLDSGFIY